MFPKMKPRRFFSDEAMERNRQEIEQAIKEAETVLADARNRDDSLAVKVVSRALFNLQATLRTFDPPDPVIEEMLRQDIERAVRWENDLLILKRNA